MKIINEYIKIDNQKDSIVELDIYGDIEDSKFWDEDVTPKMIRDELKQYDKAKELDIHINSYGGSTSAGNGIISIIDTFKRKTNCAVNAYIEGMCASMASGIAMCANKIYMSDNALMLIHKPLAQVVGNANDMRDAIDFLEKAEVGLVKNYMRHWKGTENELKDALAATTIYTADEALEVGLCDEIIGGVKIAASAKGLVFGNLTFSTGNSGKISYMIENKYPDIKIEKEEDEMQYDERLKDYGIDKSKFEAIGIEADKILDIAGSVSDFCNAKNPESNSEFQFVDKATVLSELGCEDITADELINYAKAGMNPVDNTEISNKAKAYDKIVEGAKSNALVNALKAQGDSYNEARMKKYLDVLTYDEIVEQDKAWQEEAKKLLNAGKRISQPLNVKEVNEKVDDIDAYKF